MWIYAYSISDQEKSETYLCLHEIDPCVHKDMLSFHIELKKARYKSFLCLKNLRISNESISFHQE